MSADLQILWAVSGPADIMMVPIPHHIYPASSIMNCFPRIHFIVPSHWELKGIYSWLSLNHGPHGYSHHTWWENDLSNVEHKACEATKVLVCPHITNSTCYPGLELGHNWLPAIEKTKWRENSLPQKCLLGPGLTVESKTPQSCLNSVLKTLLPPFLHFLLIRLLDTLVLIFSRSPNNYHSAKTASDSTSQEY